MKLFLGSLSDEDLIANLKKLIQEETEITEKVIEHLAEVEIRRLYARLGYTSLFDYAQRGLGYAGGSAIRRIQAARALAHLPEVGEMLEKGEVTLSSIAACGKVLTGDDGKMVLEELRGKTRHEAEAIAARYREPVELKDKVEKVVLRSETPRAQQGFGFETESYRRCGCDQNSRESDELFRISFAVSPVFIQKLKRARELLFEGSAEDTLLETVLEESLDVFLEKYDPAERQKRREARKLKKMEVHAKELKEEKKDVEEDRAWFNRMSENLTNESPEDQEKFWDRILRRGTEPEEKRRRRQARKRYVPRALRDEILKRDGYRCTYVSPSGVRCAHRAGLEMDHIVPVARGGRSTKNNLRTLCRTHNLLAARDELGSEFVDGMIRDRELEAFLESFNSKEK